MFIFCGISRNRWGFTKHGQAIGVGAGPQEKVHYLPYFVDQACFGSIDSARTGKTLLGVGRFVEKKAPHLTLLAFSEEGDYRTMASRIVHVLQMEDHEVLAMSQSARQRIRTHFGKGQTLDRLAELLRSVVK